MTSLMQRALGADWDRLPPALQAHYADGTSTDTGHLDIDYPRAMQPLLMLLKGLGALIHRRGRQVSTTVVKQIVATPTGERQEWRRVLHYDDGQVIRFDSTWILNGPGRLIEFVNPVLGLEMAPFVVGEQLHYRGIRFVAKLGPWMLTIPQWLLLGTTSIVEQAIDETHFAMDFRMTHPWFGELFRYAGVFESNVEAEVGQPASADR